MPKIGFVFISMMLTLVLLGGCGGDSGDASSTSSGEPNLFENGDPAPAPGPTMMGELKFPASVDGGNFLLGGTTEVTVTLENTATNAITLSNISLSAASLTFKGGTFPGTGGTCTTTFVAASSCSVKLVIDGAVEGAFKQSFNFKATLNAVTVSIAIEVKAAVVSVCANTKFGAQGFIQNNASPTVFQGDQILLPNGDLIVSEYVQQNALSGNIYVSLRSYSCSGALNAGFGTNGVVNLAFPVSYLDTQSNQQVVAPLSRIVRQIDGKLILGFNETKRVDTSTIQYWHFLRFNANGSADNTFGGNTGVTVEIPNGAPLQDMQLLSDGRVMAYGAFGQTYYVRLLANGNFDDSFGTNGRMALGVTRHQGRMLLLPDNKFIIATFTRSIGGSNSLTLTKRFSNGVLDLSFGTDGVLTVQTANSSLGFQAVTSNQFPMAISDGKILLLANLLLQGPNNEVAGKPVLMRFLANGAKDTAFGLNGERVLEVPAATDRYTGDGLAVAKDGKITVLALNRRASADPMTVQDIAIYKLNASGALIPTFGTNGRVRLASMGNQYQIVSRVDLFPDDRFIFGVTNRANSRPVFDSNGSLTGYSVLNSNSRFYRVKSDGNLDF